jgi:PKD repeat protein
MAFIALQKLRVSVVLSLAVALTFTACGGGGGGSTPIPVYSSTSFCANGLALTSTVSQAVADALVPTTCPPISASQLTALSFTVNTVGAGLAASSKVSLNNLPAGATLMNSAVGLQDTTGHSYALAITVNPLRLTATPALPFATTFTVASGSLNFTNLPSVSLVGKTIVTGAAPQAPVSIFSLGAAPYYVGESVSFNGAASTDADGTITSYAWSFGDGGAGAGKTVSHSYLTSGSYVVSLTVTDDTGMVNVNTASINVVVRPTVVVLGVPVASIGILAGPPFDGTQRVGVGIGFSGLGSKTANGTIVSYAWDFGDGAIIAANSNSVGSHAYTSIGTYQVTLTVADSAGQIGSVTRTVNVQL